MKKVLFISDLDGTLLDSTTRVSDNSARIISDLTRRGALISVATARTPATVEPLLSRTFTSIPAIVMTGASLWDRSALRFVSPRYIGRSHVDKALDAFEGEGVEPFVYCTEGERLVAYRHGEMTAEESRFVADRQGLELKRFDLVCSRERLREVDNVILIFGMGPKKELDLVARRLAEIGGYSVSFYEDIHDSHIYYIEVFAEGVSKANAVRELARLTGAERVVVYGDNLNDLSMFEVADESVAVANALPEVKEVASRIIGTNNEDAVALDIQKQFDEL